VVSLLVDQGIAGGFPVGKYYKGMDNVLLLAFTEKRTKEEIDILVARIEAALQSS
jgi:glycine dehydrogenase subunit 1